MPLLSLFSRKKSNSKGSVVAYSASNISLNDEDYVSVVTPSPVSNSQHMLPTSSSRAAPHSRPPNDHSKPYQIPLLKPSPRFHTRSDDHDPSHSTRSLPTHAEAERRSLHPQISPHKPISTSPLLISPKKSLFNWASNKDRKETLHSVKAETPDTEDTSFNLRSFRHIRPDSPSVASSSGRRSPSSSPTFTPVPTSTLPPQPVSFQVTSRRPRGNSTTQLESSPSAAFPASTSASSTSTATITQQKIPAGVFRQAARRSATSLVLTDSPRLSAVRNSLDDRPPSLLLQSSPPATSASTTSLPPRPPRPPPPSVSASSFRSQPNPRSTMPSPSLTSASYALSTPTSPPVSSKSPRQAQQLTNAFGSSSESESSEDEEEESDSGDDSAGVPRITRRRTIRQASVTKNITERSAGQSQTRTSNLPPLGFSSQENQLSDTRTSARFSSATTDDMPRPSSSLSVYGNGTRPRASLSVGALTPSAKEARTSMVLAANARLSNYTIQTTPKPVTQRLARGDESDTPESDTSRSDSEEDAPLSSLLLPRRPGTSLSSHSTSTVPVSRKPLVDLSAPSTLTGRPVAGPPPISREDEGRSRPKVNVDTSVKSRTAPVSAYQVKKNSQMELTRHSHVSSQSSSGGSQGTSIRTPTGNDKSSASSRNDRAPRYSSFAGEGTRMSSFGPNVPSVTPPARPFVRRDSPVSSTGDSSSGRAPYTPRDGSDTRSAYSRPPSAISTGRERSTSYGRTSVTFEDNKDVTIRGKGENKGKGREPCEEVKRKERRRTEARAAIELGNVVNGPPPIDPDEIDSNPAGMGMQGGWPQLGMQVQMPMQMQMPMSNPAMFNMGGMGMQSPAFGFPSPLTSADPAFVAAHQKAMAIAKQTFQLAVAQQALAVANEEWERNSNMTGYAPSTSASPWGYGMGMQQNAMFPPVARSMYAGSVNGGSGSWGGTGSAYGEAFGPAAAAAGGRMSAYPQGVPDVPTAVAARGPVRPRTKTAPSAATPPANMPTGRMPPSSFRGPGR
ncbi:hypothetical protein BU17DRAFT_81594 [Hysterangium stoloniferum]|nr:hypothetical protein BU17DRAFT_81594 [Hysterangium stoloniferum]